MKIQYDLVFKAHGRAGCAEKAARSKKKFYFISHP